MRFIDRIRGVFCVGVAAALSGGAAYAQPSETEKPFSKEAYDKREAGASDAIKKSLAEMRNEIKSKGYKFEVGYTNAMDADLKTVANYRPPTDENRKAIAKQLADISITKPKAMAKAMSALPSSFNWQTQGKVTSVRNQGDYGNCWAFAAVGAYESNYWIRHNIVINGSEESIIDQTPFGSGPDGGFPEDAFMTMMMYGMAKESAYPYQGFRTPFPSSAVAKPYKASYFGYAGLPATVASTNDIKNAVRDHGPVSTCMYAGPKGGMFQAYLTGVYDYYVSPSTAVTHCVLIVGWDDSKSAWRIKNSWGTSWGENGYGWVKYGVCRIGFDATWVESTKAN